VARRRFAAEAFMGMFLLGCSKNSFSEADVFGK
jgi:hypothetical protein